MEDVKAYMSINPILDDALSDILPIAHAKYSGAAKTYATFIVYNNNPAAFASGKNHKIEAYGDIDVFSDVDLSGSSSLIDSIDEALNDAGVTVLNIRDTAYDGVAHHKIIEFYISRDR